MKILTVLLSAGFFYLIFTIVVRIRSRSKGKIKEIFHGHVYWETGDNTTNNTSGNNLRSISEVNEDITIPDMNKKPVLAPPKNIKKLPSISDYTKRKMDKWFLRMQSIGTPVPKLIDIKGGSIIDVGANVGVFSNNVRKVCKDCHIFAFEAVPDFAKYIESRNIGNIDVYPFGLSDESASADFWLSKNGNYGWNTMIPDNKYGRKNMKKVKLDFKAFDELDTDVGNLKLIKIDTEGAEYKVLKGLINVIQKYKPVVFVEFAWGNSHPNYREEIDEFDKLIEMGYTCDRDYKKVKSTTDLVFRFPNKKIQ